MLLLFWPWQGCCYGCYCCCYAADDDHDDDSYYYSLVANHVHFIVETCPLELYSSTPPPGAPLFRCGGGGGMHTSTTSTSIPIIEIGHGTYPTIS